MNNKITRLEKMMVKKDIDKYFKSYADEISREIEDNENTIFNFNLN